MAPSPACRTCHPPAASKTILHFFISCSRTAAAWHLLFFKATITLGAALTDETLLYLAWPPSVRPVRRGLDVGRHHLHSPGHQVIYQGPGPSHPPGQGLQGRRGWSPLLHALSKVVGLHRPVRVWLPAGRGELLGPFLPWIPFWPGLPWLFSALFFPPVPSPYF